MTRDDIIRVAREFGWAQKDIDSLLYVVETAAAAERQKVADWMLERSYATGHGDTTEDLLKELEWQIRESEREACCGPAVLNSAGVIGSDNPHQVYAKLCAAICARGQA